MKKELLCMMLGCALIFSGCSNVDLGENFDSGINTTQQMTVNFVPMVLGEGTGNSRVAASSYNDPTKVTILAYKKVNNEAYKLEKMLQEGNAATSLVLPVGIYRFVAFYNIGKQMQLNYPENASSWDKLVEQITLNNLEASPLDVNEVFVTSQDCGEVNVSEVSEENNTISVTLQLKRINARIDVLVKKVNKNGNEQPYKEGNVFGTEPLAEIVTATTAVGKWNWNHHWSDESKKSYTDTNLDANICIGTSDNPTVKSEVYKDGNKDLIDAGKIMKGSAYYKGVYVLPFVNENTKLDEVNIKLVSESKDADNAPVSRTLKATKVKAIQNYVTLITFNIQTDLDDGETPDDSVNVFTPNIQYNIQVDTNWEGVDYHGDIEI